MRVRHRINGSRSGFTLIELLVVISIIALLISILLPSLREAREQAKRVVCQSNLKNVNTSLLTYVSEYDTYPVLFKESPLSWATWSYGGWTGKDFETYCDDDAQGMFCFQTYQRPLSVYMLQPRQIDEDAKGRDRAFGTADDVVTHMPAFQCPADDRSTQWMWNGPGASEAVKELSAYDQCGASYQMNFYWFFQAEARARRWFDEHGQPHGALDNWREAFRIGRRLWQRNDEHGGASRFVTMVEDPFDWGIAQGLSSADDAYAEEGYQHATCGEQTMGFHGLWSRHMLAFLDGHVGYVRADTRYQRQPNWTVTNDDWHDTRRAESCP